MRAMLLAAGRGDRMQPLTGKVPKPAIPVLGRGLGAQILRRLARTGIARAVVNLHHLPDAVVACLGSPTDLGLERLDFSRETDGLLGTGGGIRNAASLLRGEGTILVRNADFLADIDIGEALEAHRASGREATLVLSRHRAGYTPVYLGTGGTVLSIGPPARGQHVEEGPYLFTGMQFLEERVLDRIPPIGPSDIVRDVHLPLVREGGLGGWVHGGFWWEFGTPEAYLEGSFRLLDLDRDARARVVESDPVYDLPEATVAVGAGADFHSGVELRGRVALGFASLISEGSVIDDSVVMPEAWIGPGCRVVRCIIGPGTEIPAGFDGEGLVVAPPGPGQEPAAGVERRGALLVRPMGRAGTR